MSIFIPFQKDCYLFAFGVTRVKLEFSIKITIFAFSS